MKGRLVARTELRAGDVGRMYALLDRHFEGVDPGGFRADLAEKDWVVLLEGGAGGREGATLLGFTTLRLDREVYRGREVTVVYSGDTIVDPGGWGTPVLPRTWIRSVRGLHRLHGAGPLFWLLITSGFRTYRFLPVFCRTFHAGPSPDVPEGGRGSGEVAAGPEAGVAASVEDLGRMADVLARRRFGDAYDPGTGIVRLPRPQRLREPLLDVPAGRLDDPHVRRFLRLNPGHARGDELVCLASLDDDNLTRAGRRMLHGRRREGRDEGPWASPAP